MTPSCEGLRAPLMSLMASVVGPTTCAGFTRWPKTCQVDVEPSIANPARRRSIPDAPRGGRRMAPAYEFLAVSPPLTPHPPLDGGGPTGAMWDANLVYLPEGKHANDR